MSKKIEKLLRQADEIQQSHSSEGSSKNCAERVFASPPEAEAAFEILKNKLLKIENWNSESGVTTFALFDKSANQNNKKTISPGDFIRLTLPASGKDDWVKVIEIFDTDDECVLTVSPSHNPTEKDGDEDKTSHFFSGEATNNFCLEKSGAKVRLCVIGLHEKANTSETESRLEAVRNFAAANIGYFTGFQDAEWQTFCKNFIENVNAES